jgi:hypothetical protein
MSKGRKSTLARDDEAILSEIKESKKELLSIAFVASTHLFKIFRSSDLINGGSLCLSRF